MKCPTCKGTGNQNYNKDFHYTRVCWMCNGKGQINLDEIRTNNTTRNNERITSY